MDGLAGCCELPGADPLRTMLEVAKWLASPWKLTKVKVCNFDAKEGFNLAEEIHQFLSLFASGSLKKLKLNGFRANALVSMTHEGFFKKLPEYLKQLVVRSYANSGGFCFFFRAILW